MSGGSFGKADLTDPTTLDNVTKWIKMGFTEASVAKALGYSPTYFSELKRKIPELSEAIKDGRYDLEQLIVDKFIGMMFDDNHPKQFSALVYYSKAKLGWRDTTSNTEPLTEPTTKLNFTKIKK